MDRPTAPRANVAQPRGARGHRIRRLGSRGRRSARGRGRVSGRWGGRAGQREVSFDTACLSPCGSGPGPCRPPDRAKRSQPRPAHLVAPGRGVLGRQLPQSQLPAGGLLDDVGLPLGIRLLHLTDRDEATLAAAPGRRWAVLSARRWDNWALGLSAVVLLANGPLLARLGAQATRLFASFKSLAFVPRAGGPEGQDYSPALSGGARHRGRIPFTADDSRQVVDVEVRSHSGDPLHEGLDGSTCKQVVHRFIH